MYGQGITRGRVGILGIDATTNQACAAVTPRDEMIITTDYLYFYLEYFYEELRSRGHGANQKNLSMTLLKIFPVAFPAKCDQEAITRALKSADKKIALATTKRNGHRPLQDPLPRRWWCEGILYPRFPSRVGSSPRQAIGTPLPRNLWNKHWRNYRFANRIG